MGSFLAEETGWEGHRAALQPRPHSAGTLSARGCPLHARDSQNTSRRPIALAGGIRWAFCSGGPSAAPSPAPPPASVRSPPGLSGPTPSPGRSQREEGVGDHGAVRMGRPKQAPCPRRGLSSPSSGPHCRRPRLWAEAGWWSRRGRTPQAGGAKVGLGSTSLAMFSLLRLLFCSWGPTRPLGVCNRAELGEQPPDAQV